ncbi:hypothetical protein Q3G72_012605 [Acer saccharum]|nr:hypothetical protein Q3G72_012605 [Acer saccharum]
MIIQIPRAVLEGLLWAFDKGWFPVLIESDAFGIVNLCTGKFDSWSDVNNIVFDILLLIDRYRQTFRQQKQKEKEKEKETSSSIDATAPSLAYAATYSDHPPEPVNSAPLP